MELEDGKVSEDEEEMEIQEEADTSEEESYSDGEEVTEEGGYLESQVWLFKKVCSIFPFQFPSTCMIHY